MSSGFCGIPGMSQPRLDRCEGEPTIRGCLTWTVSYTATASKRRTAQALCWNVMTLNHLREVMPNDL